LDTADEGFTEICSDEEALKLIEDYAMTVGWVIDMLAVDVYLG
jgi:hypothetical protein